jgi:hypothetical protein
MLYSLRQNAPSRYITCAVIAFSAIDGQNSTLTFMMIFIEQDLIPKEDKGAYNHV